ncbi:SCP2 sterol-binding domain-containing protein [Halomarina salina]|uniref:SCP2 sterol-binding domain-containing protein n=1 Tax=Halomarina salina TaxID=1872699 RepID=A0ABD5RN27_9EURY|nr:SCP2 sterol-binding domain-containing protein [Halomarina salina]
MTDDQLVARIEESFEKDDDELEEELPELLDEIDGQTDELARENPELVAKILGRMQEMDIASFVSDNPETADQFQDLLWSGVRVLAENDDEVSDQIDETITVNFEADDCPMTGHLETNETEGTVTGGAGHLDDPDLTITGPADTLVGLITGGVDPIQGFMQQKYEMDGPVNKGTKLAPIMNSLSEKATAPQ